MIREAILSAMLLTPALTWAAEAIPETATAGNAAAPEADATPETDATPEAEPDASLDRYRTPVEALTERMIGSASKSVRFDWRKSPVAFGITGSELLERNNFGSTRLGGFVRMPLGNFLGEVAVTNVFSWGTDSTEKLALTPYRQFGRPSRLELDFNLGHPIAEGVATALPGFIPAAEFVLSANVGFRYLFYPGGFRDESFGDVAAAVLTPRLTEDELQNLEYRRPGGMQIDSARYGLLAGLSTDVYFQPGIFVSPRMMVALPLLSPLNGTGLGFWWELSLGLGWAL